MAAMAPSRKLMRDTLHVANVLGRPWFAGRFAKLSPEDESRVVLLLLSIYTSAHQNNALCWKRARNILRCDPQTLRRFVEIAENNGLVLRRASEDDAGRELLLPTELLNKIVPTEIKLAMK